MSQTASLEFKPSGLTLNSSTSTGTADQYGTSFTWTNISLRVLFFEYLIVYLG